VTAPAYTKGHHELGQGCHAWLVPDGSWGWSNAGLVQGDGVSLLVDTLFDVALTREMLEGLKPLTDRTPIATLVNTHANGDHWFGNQLLKDTEIVASRATAEEMATSGPQLLTALRQQPGAVGRFAREIFSAFDWSDVEPTLPTRTFDASLTIDVGDTAVELHNLGPAHTRGDTVAVVPSARTVFAGDLLFIGGTPIVWAGPPSNWIRACESLLALDVDTIVPGHGPVTDKDGVNDVIEYLRFVAAEAGARHAAGMTAVEAMWDIHLGKFESLPERGRLAQNVLAVYYEIDPTTPRVDALEVFRRMAALHGMTD